MRILGIDPGEVRVGVAVSDPLGVVAVPVAVYKRDGEGSPESLAGFARAEGIELIVVGLPLRADGSAGTQARRARRFARALESASGLPVVFWDERFTTQLAGRAMIESGTSRRHRKSNVDSAAATIILQDYLDSNPQTRGRVAPN